MKIQTTELKSALDRLSKITGKRSTLPVLSCVRVSAENNTLELVASNLDEYQRESIPCVGELPPCCVSTLKLQWSLGGESVEIEMQAGKMLVTFDNNETNLAVLEAEEFPKWPDDKTENIGVCCTELAESIDKVSWAACAIGLGRYELESVHIQGSSKLLVCESASTNVAARIESKLIGSAFEIIVPVMSSANLCDSLNRKESILSVCEKFIQVNHSGGAYLTKQLDGKYPDVKSAFPSNIDKVGVVTKDEFKTTFERCSFYSTVEIAHAACVQFDFSKSGCMIWFAGSNDKSKGRVSGNFESASWLFSSELFKRILNGITGKAFYVFASDRKSVGPIVIEDGDLKIVAMPTVPQTSKTK
jgi:DNA polymerase III sliding clamp (beta) subunit (PCNA family)